MILSILICTIPSRQVMFEGLLGEVFSQIHKRNATGMVEVLWDNSTACTTGRKRNHLLTLSKGKYIVFIDDDDEISENYLELILNALQDNPDVDCVGMRGYVTFDGARRKDWSISIEHKYWHETVQEYLRTPNHISPVRREIAMKSMFPDTTKGEDKIYSDNIFQFLKKEVYINQYLYHYKYINK